jgi:hypothetical protein
MNELDTYAPEVSEHTEDDNKKNPIFVRLHMYEGTVAAESLPALIAAESLPAVIAAGRDYFHTFIAGTLKRKYRRIVPIYLVDDWVVDALGIFMTNGSRAIPEEPKKGHLDLSKPIDLKALAALFAALKELQRLVNGVRLLKLSALMGKLSKICHLVSGGQANLVQLDTLAKELIRLVQSAATELGRAELLRNHVDHNFVDQLVKATKHLVELAHSAHKASKESPPSVPGTGFDKDRSSGVLFGSIPALNIEGPAILIAPNAVTEWANNFIHIKKFVGTVPKDGMAKWFGISNDAYGVAAVGLVNVLQHELTHAMVSLPNDPVQDSTELFRRQWLFYEQKPSFEEGLCNATAVVATGIALLKAKFDVAGRTPPNLHRGKYLEPSNELFHALEETYADYYRDATSIWLRAWQNNNRDFGAFSGLVKLYSTNFSGIDWEKTYREFENGRISTGG